MTRPYGKDLYIMRTRVFDSKCGRANNPPIRLKEVQRKHPTTQLQLVATLKNYGHLERKWHQALNQYSLGEELFDRTAYPQLLHHLQTYRDHEMEQKLNGEWLKTQTSHLTIYNTNDVAGLYNEWINYLNHKPFIEKHPHNQTETRLKGLTAMQPYETSLALRTVLSNATTTTFNPHNTPIQTTAA